MRMPEYDTIKNDVVEQIMRACTSDVYVIPFLSAEPGTDTYKKALGKLLEVSPQVLVIGTPLTFWTFGGLCSSQWRSECITVDNSVWEELQFRESLMSNHATILCPMSRLLDLREISL